MKQLHTRYEMEKLIEAANPDKDFVNAVLKAMKNLGTKNMKRVMDAMAAGKYADAASILGKKKGLSEATDNAKLIKDAIKAMKTAQSKIELMDRESSKMSPAGITGIIADMIKIRHSLSLAIKSKIA